MSRRSSIRRLPRAFERLTWVVAAALAVGGGVLYLIEPTDRTWWIGIALVLPLVLLVVAHVREAPQSTHSYVPPPDGTFGPP